MTPCRLQYRFCLSRKNLQHIYSALFPPKPRRGGFSLAELLVAIAILTIILLVSFQLISGTSGIWIRSNSKMIEGREARVAFNSMISRLSQATVNPYYGYTWTGASTGTATPISYVRHSELRFYSGPSATLIPTFATTSPTDAVFFVAPLGYVSNTTDYGHLPSLLNICGYYIQWSNVDLERPSILPSVNLPYSFQLMQFVQPSEQMSLYNATANNYANGYKQVTTSPAWQTTALFGNPAGTTALNVRPIARNVIALLLLPATSTTDTSGTLTPVDYQYNSEKAATGVTTANTSVNRAPPVMRVVMYTIDDISAKKLSTSTTMPNLYVDTSSNPIFTNPTKLFPNPTSGEIGDLSRFEATLVSQRITFRRFEAAVELPRQPWNYQN